MAPRTETAERFIPTGDVACGDCKGSGAIPHPTDDKGQIACPRCGGRGHHTKGAGGRARDTD